MKKYNADETPDATDWLAAGEDERIEAVRAYHRRLRVRLPTERLHATIHMIVENQLAAGEAAVVDTFERLEREGLNRHEAIHAIGKVLAEHIYDLLHDAAPDPGEDVNTAYFEALRQLTAEDWRNAG